VAAITSGHCALHLRIQAPAALPGERRTATRRVRHNSPAHPLMPHSQPHHQNNQPHHQQDKKPVDLTRRECLHAACSGAEDITAPPRIIAAARGRAGCHLDRALPLRAYRSGPPAFPAAGLRSLPPAAYAADRAVVTSVTLSLWWGSDDAPGCRGPRLPPALVSVRARETMHFHCRRPASASWRTSPDSRSRSYARPDAAGHAPRGRHRRTTNRESVISPPSGNSSSSACRTPGQQQSSP